MKCAWFPNLINFEQQRKKDEDIKKPSKNNTYFMASQSQQH